MEQRLSKPTFVGLRIPKGTLKRLSLGQSFAEYDKILEKENVFVETPAIRAAVDPTKSKCFFVGRRGTGKTAITLFLERKFPKNTLLLLPQLLTPVERFFELEAMQNVHQQPFKSLVSSFKRAMLDEVLVSWINRGLFSFKRTTLAPIAAERAYVEEGQFDLRLLAFAERILESLSKRKDKEWLLEISIWKDLGNAMDRLREDPSWNTHVLIDRIDESWDGTDKAVVLLMALMHACVELASTIECIHPLVFLRENVFDRVRQIDKEFTRLETFVVSLDWSRELLVELVERRLNVPLIAKFPLHGPTWSAFFEDPSEGSSKDIVLNYCQYRPRDVLIYCSFAIESAPARVQEKISLEDLQAARRRFSDSRLKDLCDEYADNYPQLQLVLGRFYGLGKEFTVQGIDDFVKKLLIDDEIKQHCKTWLYHFTRPDLFIHLLYNIGFLGIKDGGSAVFRSLGPDSSSALPIGAGTSVVIHPSYAEALNLQDVIVSSLDESVTLKQSGLIGDLPGGIHLNEYQKRLSSLRDQLKSLPEGRGTESEFEEVVGEILRLCFYKVLTNIEPKVRTVDGRVIRDWIAANHAPDGFWELVRNRYAATQLIWECKNYSDLQASDFHQAAYYMTEPIGRFSILAFRGLEKKRHYYEHIKRIASDKNGIVLLFHDKDLDVFLRHAMSGKSNEPHLREIYDTTVREIS
jgi:hypothetical protein